PGLVQGAATGIDHGGVEGLGVLLDNAAGQEVRGKRDLDYGDHLPGFVDDDLFGARGALVDGQHVGHGVSCSATRSKVASMESMSGIASPCRPGGASSTPS